MNPNPLAAANMVNQLFNAGDPDQYKRELVQNAIHAGATDIEAGAIRLGEFGEEGGVKAAFIDNGRGMSATKLVTAGQGGVAVTAGRRAPQCPAPQLLHPARALGSQRWVGDPLPGRGLHQSAQHAEKSMTDAAVFSDTSRYAGP